jgi:hypothetical protein
MATIYHPARYTADTLKTQADHWFIRLTGDEHQAFATVRAALERIANEDLGADNARKES